MRITDPDNLDNVSPTAAAETSARTTGHTRSEPGTIDISGDRTELSSVAGRLSEMLQTDPARAARIRELKAQVSNGTYEVDAEAVSRAIVNHALTKP